MPVRERHERRDAERGAERRRGDDRLPADAVGEVSGGQEAENGDEISGSEDDPDLLRARAELPEVQRPDR